MYQELTKEMSNLGKDESLSKNVDVMKELNDVFTGLATASVKVPQPEKRVRKGKEKKEPLN